MSSQSSFPVTNPVISMLKASCTDLASILVSTGTSLTIKRIGPLSGPKLCITLEGERGRFVFVASITEVLECEVVSPATPYREKRTGGHGSLIHTAIEQGWTADTLQAHGLPPYLDEKWLRNALNIHGSFAEIQRVYGYCDSALSRAAYRFNIIRRPHIDQKVKQQAARMLAEGQSAASIARQLGISKPTVLRLNKSCRTKSQRTGVA